MSIQPCPDSVLLLTASRPLLFLAWLVGGVNRLFALRLKQHLSTFSG